MILCPFLAALTTGETIIAILAAVIVLVIGYFAGKFVSTYKHSRLRKSDKDRMFDIEKALKNFYEHEKKKLDDEKAELRHRIEMLEKQLDDARKKAAGVGLMGMGKDKKTDLLMGLMLENEQLEEKLYQMNLRMKEERDEMISRELEHISYKKVMLSTILQDKSVREHIGTFLADKKNVEKIDLHALPTP
jgi:hypothetical protein